MAIEEICGRYEELWRIRPHQADLIRLTTGVTAEHEDA